VSATNNAAEIVERLEKRYLQSGALWYREAAELIAELERVRHELYCRNAEVEKLTEALEMFDDLIEHQYTGSREAMSAMHHAAQAAAIALGRLETAER